MALGRPQRSGGDYRGHDEVRAFFKRVMETTAGTFTVSPVAILVGERHLFMFNNLRGSRNGKTLDVLAAECFKFRPDGKIGEFFDLVNDQAALEEFFCTQRRAPAARPVRRRK